MTEEELIQRYGDGDRSFVGADLRRADLQSADLRGADLRRADLRRADLQSADLQSADLRRADLEGADLRGADLEGADLEGADLRGAGLQGADLRGAKGWQSSDWFELCKQQIFYVLSHSPNREIQGLKAELQGGTVHGTSYDDECCCLVGTLEKARKFEVSTIPFYSKGMHNPAEQFFWNIREGDTPENSEFSKIAVELCDIFFEGTK